MDRTTKLAAIALGLFANAAVSVLRPATAVEYNSQLADIQSMLGRISLCACAHDRQADGLVH